VEFKKAGVFLVLLTAGFWIFKSAEFVAFEYSQPLLTLNDHRNLVKALQKYFGFSGTDFEKKVSVFVQNQSGDIKLPLLTSTNGIYSIIFCWIIYYR
jgi:hypothetical protein